MRSITSADIKKRKLRRDETIAARTFKKEFEIANTDVHGVPAIFIGVANCL
jgi:hypothetical protein